MLIEPNSLAQRFDEGLFVTMQNLGPKLIAEAQVGLTPGQVFMLHYIRQGKPCNVSRLAEKMDVNPSAITVMLDRLESNGFVVRTRDTNDRRVVVTHLTDAGTEALNHVLAVRHQVVEHCLSQLPPDEATSFVETLKKLADISANMDVKTILGLPESQNK